jgi:hypothetical protein
MIKRVTANEVRRLIKKFAPWFELHDYNICANFNLEQWGFNIKIRQFIFIMLESFKRNVEDGQDQATIDCSIKIYWNNFITARKVLLQKDGVNKYRNNNKDYFSNSLNFTPWRKPARSIRQLDYFDVERMCRHLTRGGSTDVAFKNYKKIYDPRYIVVDLSINKKRLCEEFEQYINRQQEIYKHKKCTQVYLSEPPNDFNKIKGGGDIGEKFLKAKVLQFFDLRIIAQINNFKITDEVLCEILDIELEKIRRDTKRIIEKFIKDADSPHFKSLMLQIQNPD